MIVIAASLYLPENITMMAKRAWFYYAGDESGRDFGVLHSEGVGHGGFAAAGVGSSMGPRLQPGAMGGDKSIRSVAAAIRREVAGVSEGGDCAA